MKATCGNCKYWKETLLSKMNEGVPFIMGDCTYTLVPKCASKIIMAVNDDRDCPTYVEKDETPINS